MTIPTERTRAVLLAEEFLEDLVMRPSELWTGHKVPKKVSERANQILRHFPSRVYLEQSAESLPDIWGKP